MIFLRLGQHGSDKFGVYGQHVFNLQYVDIKLILFSGMKDDMRYEFVIPGLTRNPVTVFRRYDAVLFACRITGRNNSFSNWHSVTGTQ